MIGRNFKKNWESTLAASLFHRKVAHYEVAALAGTLFRRALSQDPTARRPKTIPPAYAPNCNGHEALNDMDQKVKSSGLRHTRESVCSRVISLMLSGRSDADSIRISARCMASPCRCLKKRGCRDPVQLETSTANRAGCRWMTMSDMSPN